MTRREFLTALIGSTAAMAMLPLGSLAEQSFIEPKWLRQAAALSRGDVFTITGVHLLDLRTGREIPVDIEWTEMA